MTRLTLSDLAIVCRDSLNRKGGTVSTSPAVVGTSKSMGHLLPLHGRYPKSDEHSQLVIWLAD